MFPSPRLGLLALLRGIRSIGNTLKSMILRCLLFRPHILRNLTRRIWLLFSESGASPKDLPKKKGGQARPSFPAASGGCKEYSAIYASLDFSGGGGPRFPSGPDNAEVLHLSPMTAQSQIAPQSQAGSPASSPASSLHGSIRPFDRRSLAGSTPSIADGTQLPIHRSNSPLTLTHSRSTSTQFAGAPRLDRPRPPSPFLHHLHLPQLTTPGTPAASPVHSRPSSPLAPPQPQLHPFPRSSSPISTQTPDAEQILRDTPEGYRQPEITISPPSRSQTADDSQQHSAPNPSDLESFRSPSGSPYLVPGSSRHSSGRLPTGIPALSSNQAQYQFQLPYLFPGPSQVSVGTILTPDASGNWPDQKTRIVKPMHSDQVSRYVNKGEVPLVDSEWRLHPMEVDLPQYSYAKRTKGWVPVTNPGGSLYFYNSERSIFTDVYMYDPNLSAEIHAFDAYLDRELKQADLCLPTDDYDLVLDIIKMDDDKIIWAYYYVDHVTKTLFWQEHYDCGPSMLREAHGVQEPGHIKLRLESLYWVHWSLYPTGPKRRKFPENAPKQLLGALLSSGIDSLTSKVSTSPYTVAEIESMRDFIKEAENLGPDDPHVITSVGNEGLFRSTALKRSPSLSLARLLSFYAHWRFLHFHGQKVSRLDRHKSIYGGSHRKRTILVRILSPILFFFPDVHLLELEKVWTDRIVVEALWKEFMQKLVSEWTEFVLYSTVMLAANVAFLAIPGVIVVPQNTSSPNAWIKPSPAQIASSISLVFSIGSIITGLLLIRRNRTMMTKDPKSAWYYLYGMNWPVVGLEPLAIVFSLTYALLMWSAWGFFVALLIFSFQDTSMRIWIPVGTAAVIITALIVWCVGNTWNPEEREENPRDWLYEPQAESQENGTEA
ncbi:hypothetical protein H4582DRAFT_1843464 [Lactarius indigo]|nr:hypothetical protein H4582DRAFT_1843464 [Lactarius indigo]